MHEPLRIAPHNLTSRRIWLELQLWPQGCRRVAIDLAMAALGEVTKLVQKLGFCGACAILPSCCRYRRYEGSAQRAA